MVVPQERLELTTYRLPNHCSFRCHSHRVSVWGLDYPLTISLSALRSRPSSLYTFLKKEAWLGITIAAMR